MITLPAHIKKIIERKFRGEESPEDEALLQEWRSQLPENEAEYTEWMRLWSETGAVLGEPAFDTAKAWELIDFRLGPTVSGKGTVPIVPARRIGFSLFAKWAVAAAVIGIGVFTGWRVLDKRIFPADLQIAEATTENRRLYLPDGSVVLLRKGGRLKYPKTIGGSERSFFLNGEAFFDVRPGKQPFRVQTDKSVIEVLGTAFLINAAGGSDRVVVATGKVSFYDKSSPGQRCILTEKQEAIFTGNGFEQMVVADSNYLSWHTGNLKFSGASLNIVARDLSDHFNLPVRLDDMLIPKAGLYPVTGDFRQQTLNQMLEEIAAFTGLTYRRQNDTIILFQP